MSKQWIKSIQVQCRLDEFIEGCHVANERFTDEKKSIAVRMMKQGIRPARIAKKIQVRTESVVSYLRTRKVKK